MGSRNSKLDAQGIRFPSTWLTQRATILSTGCRSGFSDDQVVPPLPEPPPTSIDNETDACPEKEDEGLGIEKESCEKVGDESEDEDKEREDSIQNQPMSPSFKVYCKEMDQVSDDNKEDDDSKKDDVNDDADANSNSTRTMTQLTRQSSDDSEEGSTQKKPEKERRKGIRLIQRDMLKGVGTLLHLRSHRHNISDSDPHTENQIVPVHGEKEDDNNNQHNTNGTHNEVDNSPPI